MKKIWKKLLIIFFGLLIGAVNGFFGGGGGMLCVPVLEKLMKKPTKIAHATAILIILPISVASAVTYIVAGHFTLKPGLIAGGAVLAAGFAGAFLLPKLSNKVITVIFALIMIAAGVKMVI